MKLARACVFSALCATVSFAALLTTVGGVGREAVEIIPGAFFWALVIALLLGLPFHFVAKRVGKEGYSIYGSAGALIGAIYLLTPALLTQATDLPFLLRVGLPLVISGFAGGSAFYRITK